MTRTLVRVAVVNFAALGLLALALVPGALAGKGDHGGGRTGGGSCTQNTPLVKVDNNWAWAQWGSFGLPGQELTYAINVINYDVGCNWSSFVVDLSAPDGFAVSMATNTISLKPGASGYLWATVTSPNGAADGDYPLTATVRRPGSPAAASATSYYKVYSSDTAAPTLYWPNPADGTTISGPSYTVAISSRDDHAVKKIDLFIDGVFKSTTACANISYACQLFYNWSPSAGQHTARFESSDWMGNVGVLTTTLTAT